MSPGGFCIYEMTSNLPIVVGSAVMLYFLFALRDTELSVRN